MRCVVLIGLTGVEMTTHYARMIGEEVKHRFDGARRANLITLTLSEEVLASREFTPVEVRKMVGALGAEAIVMCASECHVQFTERHSLEVISVFEPVKAALQKSGSSLIIVGEAEVFRSGTI